MHPLFIGANSGQSASPLVTRFIIYFVFDESSLFARNVPLAVSCLGNAVLYL